MNSHSNTVDSKPTVDVEKDLERRLALLGDVTISEDVNTSPVEEETKTPAEMESEIEEKTLVEPPIVEAKVVEKKPVMNPQPIMVKTQPATLPVPTTGSKNALLARIMAVQEKAKQAQLKKASETILAPTPSVTSYKEQMMEALNEGTQEKKTVPMLSTLPSSSTSMLPPPPLVESTAPPTVAGYRDKMMEALNEGTTKKKSPFEPRPPPPPSFDVVEMQQQQETKMQQPVAPPSFDAIEHNIIEKTVMPSAPPIDSLSPPMDLLSGDHLSQFTSIVPPPPSTEQAPPSFDTVQQQQINGAEICDFDLEGNALTPEEKVKMMEEQRAILAQIQKDKSHDTASEATARATAFDMRSNNAAVSNKPISCEVAACTDGAEHNITQRSVDIGGGQKVALHGQEKTRMAMKNGTAVLVKCLNCENWMQVTQSATLMFCPICSVVSPVLEQENAPTDLEVTQMNEDRKLAERLQKEENARQTTDYPGTRRGRSTAASTEEGGSWFGGLLPANMWSTEDTNSGSAEITVTRPPGSSSRSGLIDANIGTRADEGNDLHLEEESLIRGGRGNVRSARVAEQKPMFSCVVDSISSTANAMSGAMSSYTADSNETVHGVDSSSFLSVTNARREGVDGGGNYSAVPE